MTRSDRPQMTLEEEDALLDELLDVLDRVVETSGCQDMRPLWLVATQRLRAERLRQVPGHVQSVPERIRAWGKSVRSKYAALAAWRHAVLQTGILGAIHADQRRAVEVLYFTPFDRNDAPYSWSQASSRAPGASAYSSPSVLDVRARAGCAASVKLLAVRASEMTVNADNAGDAKAAFVAIGARDGTLKDVLRYESVREREESS